MPESLNTYLTRKNLSRAELISYGALIFEGGTMQGKPPQWATLHYGYLADKIKRYLRLGIKDWIVMPVFDIDNSYAGASIRLMDDRFKHDSFLIAGKYKPSIFYNYQAALPHIIANNEVFLTEGVYDTIAMVKAGIPNTLAILGTNFSFDHYFMLRGICKNVVCCFDNDRAGKDVVNKIVSECNFEHIFAANLKGDPDEYLKEHTKINLFNSVVQVIKKNENKPNAKQPVKVC